MHRKFTSFAMGAVFAAMTVSAGTIFDTLPRDDQANLTADCGQTWMTGTLGAAKKLDTIEVATRAVGASGGSVYLAVYENNAASGNAASWIKGNLVAVSSNTQDMSLNGVVNTFNFSYEALSDTTRYLYTFVDATTNGVGVGAGVKLASGTTEARSYSVGVLAFSGGNHTIASRITTTDAIGLPPQILSFTASKTAVFSNETVTLSWATANVDSLILEPGIGDVTGLPSTNIVITADMTYSLIAANTVKSVTNTVEITLREMELARVFADHMVLQRGETVPVFGIDAPGQSITVAFAGQTKTAIADSNGDWRVDLDPMVASMTGRTLTVSGSSNLSFSDVLVGEVWLAAGQSNMRFMVSQSSTAPHPENYGRIRMCDWVDTVDTGSSTVYGPSHFAKLTPEKFYAGTWQELNATTVKPQSGVAYFFANALARELAGTGPGGIDVPIGVVELGVGGTSTEAFISASALASNPYLNAAFEDPRGVRTLGQWTSGRIAKNLAGYVHSDLTEPHPHPYAPGFLYHVGLENIVPFAFKGAIWYQGESNAEFTDPKYRWNGGRLSDYQTDVMTALVESWRAAFNKPDLPFYMVQLPRISAPNRVLWPWYREAQNRVAQNLDGVEVAVVMEYGTLGDVHPKNKEPVGERLAYIARNKLYGESIPYSGPVYTSQEIVGNKIILHFDHVENGLISNDGTSLRHFEIAGEDRVFVPATAAIVGDTVEVSAATVSAPVAVRYGWTMDADVNFYNANGVENLPASPFRTDDWVVAPGRKIRVACIGDSITYGFGHTDPSSYPSQLQNILGTTNFEVQNFGKGGAGVHRASNKYDSSAEYAASLAFNPDIVICNLGINDITDWGLFTQKQFIGEYRDLADAYASLSTAPLFMHWHDIGPLFPGQHFYGNPNLQTLNDWVGDSATVTGARTFDMYDFFKDHPEWYLGDHIHPNAVGYRNIAEQTFRFLATLDPLHGKPAITEFMAHNTDTLADEDGDFSDWIEIKNEGITGMVLGGHHLSDNVGNSQIWQIPASVLLEPGQKTVLFASGKNRGSITSEIHTSFTLNENGGYLGLADPTGLVLQAFAPLYPPQFADTSYGVGAGSVAALVETTSPLSAKVPVDGSDELAWTVATFNDADWTAGLAGVGYEVLAPVSGSKDSVNFPVRFDGHETWDTTFQNGWGEINGGGAAKSLDGTVFNYDHSGSGIATTLDGTTTGWNTGNKGDWTLEVRLRFNANPSGFSLWCGGGMPIIVNIYGDRTESNTGGFQANHNNLDGNFHDFRIAHDVSAGKYHVWRDGQELTPPGGVAYDGTWAESRLLFGDWSSGSIGDNFDVDIASIRYDQTGIYPPAATPIYTDLISLNTADDMTNQNASCYVRVPFTLTESLPTDSALSMDVQYDDGFVAYLNGTEVASVNAPGSPVWNSAAAGDRNDYSALTAETIDLSAYADLLVAGSNVLAIHALNSAVDAERFLISAKLTVTTPDVVGFQETATPGAVNGAVTSTSQAWRTTHFSPAELAQPSISGDAADPDGDGIPNLLEYIFGLNPRVADGVNPLWMRVEPYTIGPQTEWLLTATFPVRLGLDDATYALEFTNDLLDDWSPEPLVEWVDDTGNNGDGTHTVTYRDSDASVTNDSRFIRVSAERL